MGGKDAFKVIGETMIDNQGVTVVGAKEKHIRGGLKIMKKIVSLLLLTISLALVLSACGGSDDKEKASSDGDGKDNGKIELRFAWWGGQERHDKTLEVIELYEKKNPNIDIIPEYSGMDGYFDKLTTQFASGNAPDIIQYGGNLNDFVGKGVVLPLDEYVGDTIDISLHDENMITAATFDDKFYGVTLGTNAWGLLLNKTLFDEAGVPLPEKEWTWDDFKETTVQLSEKLDGTYGTGYFDQDGFGLFVDQNGKILHENGVLKIEKQDVIDWFELWQDLRKAGAVAPPEVQAESSETPEQSMIVKRDAAIQIVASNQLSAYKNATTDELVLHPHPYNELGNHGASLRVSQFLAGYSETKHPEEVAKFLDFFVNDLEATAILGNDRGAPVNSEVRQAIMENADEVDAAIFEYIDYVSSTTNTPFVPNLPGYSETKNLFTQVSDEIAFGQVSIEEGADYYWEELNKILDKHR